LRLIRRVTIGFGVRLLEEAAEAFGHSVGDKVGEAAGNWLAEKWMGIREVGWQPAVEKVHATVEKAKRAARRK
jgi:hypothetical protein